MRVLPCSPECANWLRYGVTPKDARKGMAPGFCGKRAHHDERLGCGGRRVLVSRYWTGKTLTEHSADRREAVRVVLESAGIELPDGHSATELRADGKPRYTWEPLDPTKLGPGAYRKALTESVRQRLTWREQYQHARDSNRTTRHHQLIRQLPRPPARRPDHWRAEEWKSCCTACSEAGEVLSLSRSKVYVLIQSGRLRFGAGDGCTSDQG